MRSSAYDTLGTGYSLTRRTDPRIAACINRALGNAASVVNVGAGAGSYEPQDRVIVAVEPSMRMIRQRPAGSAPAVQALAENLPLQTDAVDAALAVLTVHHWTDPLRGLAEMRRVARHRVVILTWDREVSERFWLVQDYFPCIAGIDRARTLTISEISSALGESEVIAVPIPHDCLDGFLGAFWRRPQAYLETRVRSGMSTFAAMPAEDCRDGLHRLDCDLHSGAWAHRHRDLLALDELDLGYRLIVGHTARSSQAPGIR